MYTVNQLLFACKVILHLIILLVVASISCSNQFFSALYCLHFINTRLDIAKSFSKNAPSLVNHEIKLL